LKAWRSNEFDDLYTVVDEATGAYHFSRMVGTSVRMQQVFVLMEKALDSDATGCFKPYIDKEFSLCQVPHI
jgi:hypothetical protein